MASSTSTKCGIAIGLLAATMLSAVPASAQSAPEPSTAAENSGDIIVTAQRREERARDVPISISAIGAAEIENRNVTSLDQLQSSVPGLRLVDIGPGSQRIQLRGISQYQGLPTVGNYLDEFSLNPLAASGPAEVRLLDLERIEVLRGPQPVLYGEGSMGGTIRYVTALPNLTEYSGNVLGEINSVRGGELGYKVEGVLNAPFVTDKASIRIAGAHEHVGGWIDGPIGKDANGTDITTVRGKLLLKPSDAFSISLLGQFHETEQDVKSYSAGDRSTGQIVPSNAQQRYYLGNLVLTYDAGPVTLLSSTGYLHQTGLSIDDSARFYNQLFGAPLLKTAVTNAAGTNEKWSQEVRATSNGSGPLSYVLGATYIDNKATGITAGDGVSLVPNLPASSLGVVFLQDSYQRSKSYAIYGSVGYDLGLIKIEAGGRYFHDKRTIDSTFTLIGLPFPPSVSRDTSTFHSFNPRLSVTLKTGRSGIIYADAAKGFRSGGFNQVTVPGVTPPTFGPENLWTYEIGTKQSLIANSLFLDVSVYYNDYKGIQANQLVNPTVATVINAGNARGPGVDITVQAKPSRDFSFTGTVGYTHLRYKTNTVDRLSGDPADLVPDWNWSAAFDYTPRLSENVGLIAHADIGFIDKARIIIRSPTFNQNAPTEAREVANARLGLIFSNLEAYIFATNIFDTNRIVNPAFGAFFEPIYTRPRTIGLGAKARF